jgi:cytochrome P450
LEVLSLRILQVNFVAIHTSSFAASHTILDLASSPPKEDYLSAIRQESETVLAEENGTWTKSAVIKMYRADSAIRESQRMNGLTTNGLVRKVVAPEGIIIPNGTHVAQGHRISTPGWAMHHDNALYEDSRKFDALRFSAPREKFEGWAKSENPDHTEILKYKNLSMITTSDQHLVFSHGKHAW